MLKADSQLSEIFELVVREQVEADRGVLSQIDIKKLKLNCNESLDIRDSTTSYLFWKTNAKAWSNISLTNSLRNPQENIEHVGEAELC